jgi:hypothetical protein
MAHRAWNFISQLARKSGNRNKKVSFLMKGSPCLKNPLT